MLNKAASTPDEIVTVADSETLIVAALAEVAMFSAAEKEVDDVKVGEVTSKAYTATTIPDPPAPVPEPRSDPPHPELARPFCRVAFPAHALDVP